MNETVPVELITATSELVPLPAPSRQVLAVRHLSRYFGDLHAVDDVSFDAAEGQVVGFIGPNGAGKTTTMRIIATLDVPNHGDAIVCGNSVIDYPDRVRRHIGYMPDSFGKYSNMNVEDYLDFYARAYGLKGRDRQRAVNHVLAFTELRKLQYKSIKALSKGMSQRLGLGRTLIHDPQLLILDEPAAGLDPRARVELRELVHLLARELNKTVLISSHILTELGEICDSVVIIEAGKVLVSGDVDEIHRQKRASRVEGDLHEVLLRTVSGFDQAQHETLHKWLLEQPFVTACQMSGDCFRLEFTGNEQQQAELLKRLIEHEFPIIEFHGKTQTLEDAFMSITRGITQ